MERLDFIKLPEHSNIRSILFIENHPNASGAYPGCFWILSFDGNGKVVTTAEHIGVGNAEFDWDERDFAEKWLERLKFFCPDASVEYLEKQDAKSTHGIFRFRTN